LERYWLTEKGAKESQNTQIFKNLRLAGHTRRRIAADAVLQFTLGESEDSHPYDP